MPSYRRYQSVILFNAILFPVFTDGTCQVTHALTASAAVHFPVHTIAHRQGAPFPKRCSENHMWVYVAVPHST